MNRKQIRAIATAGLLLLMASTTVADDVRELGWEDLIPDEEKLAPAPPPSMIPDMSDSGDDPYGKGFSTPEYPTGVVEELDGEQVKIPGFIVPLEVAAGGEISEFLLVPYFGACIHYPPPPSNQIVFVKMEEPITVESQWVPFWVLRRTYDQVQAFGFRFCWLYFDGEKR